MQQNSWLVQCKVLLFTAGLMLLVAWLVQPAPLGGSVAEVPALTQLSQQEPADEYVLPNLARHPAVLFQHIRQQPVYSLWQEFGVSPLAALPLSLPPLSSLLPWYILADACASFRLGLWQDANLHAKRLYYSLLA
ncbi:hypothetical protein Q3O60_07050 [Alkalimonas collagenimarina]|uniref:Uncharacterized protein n=1 Tax=Alkalimonas collagenimarina TaxID=400390 RepID=A0ABT9GXZ9_9GAMM|nr:hypothetical protein [Alkalimonas collagenimarina]MDP4535939.1 hypothetical protein [Alkalimonas collagenimarina]